MWHQLQSYFISKIIMDADWLCIFKIVEVKTIQHIFEETNIEATTHVTIYVIKLAKPSTSCCRFLFRPVCTFVPARDAAPTPWPANNVSEAEGRKARSVARLWTEKKRNVVNSRNQVCQTYQSPIDWKSETFSEESYLRKLIG
jgi:hypothetical protein